MSSTTDTAVLEIELNHNIFFFQILEPYFIIL